MTGYEIYAEMVRRQITQQSIADKLRVSVPFVHQVIYGKRPTPYIRQAIAKALGMSVNTLWPKKTA